MKIYVQCIDKDLFVRGTLESLVDVILAVRSIKTKDCEGAAAEDQQCYSPRPPIPSTAKGLRLHAVPTHVSGHGCHWRCPQPMRCLRNSL